MDRCGALQNVFFFQAEDGIRDLYVTGVQTCALPVSAMAAKRITEQQIAELGGLLDSLGRHPEVEDLVANDLEFHRQIAACSGNSVLCSLLETLSGPTTRARVWRGLTQAGAVERTLDEHRAILDALASRDPEVARSWATVHIASVEQWLASVL